ncbi:SPOR domain-containing protein [Olleya namhaensis]|uniref:SPOR domain-containing protein n=1 Tax=Olleya namhaensis TaxID=1144750 RepID=UPI002493B219|nr:SPOR domain-containing protein [Olleya namhaensis]
MKKPKIKAYYLTALITISFCAINYAQQGTVVINEDPNIDKLLEIKKDLNKDEKNSDKYKIQIYSGTLAQAESAKSKFDGSVGQWRSQLVFDSPNYKIQVGNFRSRLEADRALLDVQKKFSDAFIFKPKKEKE